MQSRRWSAIEAITNTVVSFVMAWAMYFTVIPWIFGMSINPRQSAGIVFVFNVSSLCRQFVMRRIFNAIER